MNPSPDFLAGIQNALNPQGVSHQNSTSPISIPPPPPSPDSPPVVQGAAPAPAFTPLSRSALQSWVAPPPPPPPPSAAEQSAAASGGAPPIPPFDESVGIQVVNTPYTKPREYNQLPPTVQAAYEGMFANKEERAGDFFQNRADMFDREAAEKRKIEEDAAAAARGQQEAHDARALEMEQRRAAVTRALDRVRETGQVDKDRVFRNQTGVDKIGTAISMFLGGLFAPLGLRDMFMDHIDRLQDRDIAMQKLEFRMAKDEHAAANTTYGQFINELGTEEAADAAMKAARLERTKALLDRQAAEQKGVVNTQDAIEYRNKLDEDIVKYTEKAMAMTKGGGGPVAIDKLTGLPLTQAQAFQLSKEHREHTNARTLKVMDTAGEIQKQNAPGGAAARHLDDRADKVSNNLNELQIPTLTALTNQYLALGELAPNASDQAIDRVAKVYGLDAGALKSSLSRGSTAARRATRDSIAAHLGGINRKRLTGAAEGELEHIRNAPILNLDDRDEGAARAAALSYLQQLNAVKNSIITEYGPEVTEHLIKRQRQAAGVARKYQVENSPEPRAKDDSAWK